MRSIIVSKQRNAEQMEAVLFVDLSQVLGGLGGMKAVLAESSR
jgi:hypothetical protein